MDTDRVDKLGAILVVALLTTLTVLMLFPSAAFPGYGMAGTGAIALCLLMAVVMKRRTESPIPASTLTAMGLVIAWAIVWSVMWFFAPVRAAGRDDALTALLCAAAFVTAFCSASIWRKDASPIRFAVTWMGVVLALLALHGVYQATGPEWAPSTFARWERELLEADPATTPMRDELLAIVRVGRASGRLGAANIFASACLAGCWLCAGIAFASRGLAVRAMAGGGALVCVVAIVYTQSRGGLLGLAFTAPLLAALLVSWKLTEKRTAQLLVGSGVVVAVLGATLVAVLFALQAQNSRWLGVSGITMRLSYWRTATAIWLENPLLGSGPGAFEILYAKHRVLGADETKHAHSWLFENLAATGLLGIGLLLAFAAVTLRRVYTLLIATKRAGSWTQHAFVCGAVAALAAMLVHGLLEYTFSFREMALLFFVLLGVMLAEGDRRREPHRSKAEPAVRFLMLSLVLLVLFAMRGWQMPTFLAGMAREDAQALLMEGDLDGALKAADDAIDRDRIDPTNWEQRGRVRQAAGDARWLDDLRRARALNPHSARLTELEALEFVRRGDMAKALQLQREAITLHPFDLSHRMTLVEMLLRSGAAEEARAAFAEASGIRPFGAAEAQRRDALQAALETIAE